MTAGGRATIGLPVTTIRFGTEDFTFHNVRRCARGVADYLMEQGSAERGVVVAHDRRFASEHFARACIEVLAAHGLRVVEKFFDSWLGYSRTSSVSKPGVPEFDGLRDQMVGETRGRLFGALAATCTRG